MMISANPFLLFFLLTLLAVFVEGSVEFFVSPWVSRLKTERDDGFDWSVLLRYVALLLSLPICFYYGLDIMAAAIAFVSVSMDVAIDFPVSPVGFFITGIIVSRGANYVNDIVSLVQRPKLAE